jgi:hypothetical protein
MVPRARTAEPRFPVGICAEWQCSHSLTYLGTRRKVLRSAPLVFHRSFRASGGPQETPATSRGPGVLRHGSVPQLRNAYCYKADVISSVPRSTNGFFDANSRT